jgi:hypothetical protein
MALRFRGPIAIYTRTWPQNFRTWVNKLKMAISHLKMIPFQRTLFITFFITPGKPFQRERRRGNSPQLPTMQYVTEKVRHLLGCKARGKMPRHSWNVHEESPTVAPELKSMHGRLIIWRRMAFSGSKI